MLLFAKFRGKKLSICKWGPSNNSLSASDGANNSFYCDAMFKFFTANAASIEYESFFDGETHQIYPRVSYNAKASDAYKAAY